jgi:L-threonylcarbamoyladenylate synthase
MSSPRILKADDSTAMGAALEVLARGGLVAFPTDTVYGVGAPAFDVRSVERIFTVKGRDPEKAIPILIAEPESAGLVAESFTANVRRLAEAFWPGPLTLVVRKLPTVPERVSRGPTIGLRVPDHPVALELLRASGPLAATSANPSGGPDPRTAEEVAAGLGGGVDLILDGGVVPGGRASTVVDCTVDPPALIREGPFSLEAILAVLRR